jgi:S-DNA-T family DNA segregation ATPase FtsK/SpoIIIE
MKSPDLIGKVAATRIEKMFDEPRSSRVLLGIVGLAPAEVCAIAREVSRLHLPNGRVEAFVHPAIAVDDIGLANLSDETAIYHRHHFDKGVALTLFSVPASEVKLVEQGLAHVEKIDDNWLMEDAGPWARHALPGSDDAIRRQFADVLKGLVASDVVVDARRLADFALRVGELVTGAEGLALGKAVRRALPALRLPRDAGDPRARIEDSPKVAEVFFRSVRSEARPALELRAKDGEPLNPNDLRKRLERLVAEDEIAPASAKALGDLIADRGIGDEPWTAAQAEAAEVSWEETEKLFGTEKPRARVSFGEETLELFTKRYRDVLTESDEQLLKDLKRDNVRPSEAHDDFFSRHKDRLQADPKLYRRWEQLVFRSPVEATDLGRGLLHLVHRVRQGIADEVNGLRLYVRLRNANVPAFWSEDKNTKLCRLLRDRWRGLPSLLGPDIVLDFGCCWSEDWEEHFKKNEEVDSTAKGSVEFEFEAFYLPAEALVGRPKETDLRKAVARAQMWWKPRPKSFATALPLDLSIMSPSSGEPAPLLSCRMAVNRFDRSGAVQSIALHDATTVTDALGDSEGRFAQPRQPDNRIDTRWLAALGRLRAEHILAEPEHDALLAAFEAFRSLYSEAIAALVHGDGLADEVLLEQAKSFGNLLRALSAHARAEVCVRDLWKPLLRIGTALVEAQRPTVLVTPLHPLRLGEIGAKARHLAAAMRRVATSRNGLADEIGSYVEDIAASLAKTYYVDVGLSADPNAVLLVETRSRDDFSLLEPARGNDDALADEPAEETVKAFERTSTDYLTLRPHERSNFSTVLIDAESEDLPVALANSMARRIEEEASLRCELVVTHDNISRLRRIYEQQNRRIGHEVESSFASESARNFLSRLRVGIVSSELLNDEHDKKHDIVVLQDVIARRAEVKWTRLQPPMETRLATHIAAAQSKRKPFRRGDTTSGTFLTAPNHPVPVAAYVDALHDALEGRASELGAPWLPLQEVEFRSGQVSEMLKKAHRLGVWVMTFDRLADKRLVGTDERRIVRSFSDPRSDHNVIVSTEIDASTLGERLQSDLEIALTGSSQEEITRIARAIHKASASLSGAIVMRGAQRTNHAHELLGLVLAARETDLLLATDASDRKAAWFFLDDFVPWLGVTDSRADLLTVDFAIRGGKPCIRLVVGEAKFVSAASLREQKTRSLKQLEATFNLLHKRFTREDGTVDPGMWRSRLADLVIENIEPFEQIGGVPYASWIGFLRHGNLPIGVTGHSFVFVHDMATNPPGQPFVPDEEIARAQRRPMAQWTFGRPAIAAGLRSLVQDSAQPQISIPPEWPSTFDTSKPEPKPAPRETAPDAAGEEARPEPSLADRAHATPVPAPEPAVPQPIATIGSAAEALAMASDEASAAGTPEGWKPAVFEAVSSMRSKRASDDGKAWLQETIAAVRNALQREKMDAPILGARLTPNSGLIYLDGTAVSVSWLERNQVDLQTRYGLEIIRITPLPKRIAIGVKRPKRAILHLADAWLRRQLDPQSPDLNLAPVIGEKEDDGALFYLPIAAPFGEQEMAAPHTLVSGTTGSGKGILASSLLLDLCAFNSPANVQIRLIDPKKGIDYAWLRGMPHLHGGIVSDKQDAIALFRSLVEEMETRYYALEASGCNNIASFNARSAVRMPRIVLFFDEVPNWMQDEDFKAEVEPLINEIATKSRAAGIHLFMIYQRADNQVMTMQLRTNLGNKLVLKLGDEGSSRIALGEKGAYQLLGKGHLIAKLDSDDKIYAQVPFIGQEEVKVLAKAISWAWARAPAQPALESA